MSRTVLLVDPFWTRDKDPRVPLGHASLMTALERAGVRVYSVPVAVNLAHLDVPLLVELLLDTCAGLTADEVDIAIGVYVWGERIVKDVIRILRARRFRGRIILGGPQISYAGGSLELLYPEADAFVRGYGEEALVALALSATNAPIQGVHYRGDPDHCGQANVELERLASPWLAGTVPLDGQQFIRWETQRGCPFRCSFCQHKEAGARLAHRALSTSRIFDEVDLFCRSKVPEIAVLDPIFNLGPRSIAVLERFAEQHYRGRLSLQCRAEQVDEPFLSTANNLRVTLEFGLQTIHATEGKAVHRQNNMQRVDETLRQVRALGIDHEVSLIFGLPGQTLASFMETVQWCLDRNIPRIKAFPLLLLRGTALELERARWGFVDDGDPMPMVVQSNTYSKAEWTRMSQISEALHRSEGGHPQTVRELIADADRNVVDQGRWQAPSTRRSAA